MGDNRAVSDDSRLRPSDPGHGTIPESAVIGRAFVIVWPPSHWRILPIPSTFNQPGIDKPAAAGQSRLSQAAADQLLTNGTKVVPSAPYVPLAAGLVGAVPLTWLQRRARKRLDRSAPDAQSRSRRQAGGARGRGLGDCRAGGAAEGGGLYPPPQQRAERLRARPGPGPTDPGGGARRGRPRRLRRAAGGRRGRARPSRLAELTELADPSADAKARNVADTSRSWRRAGLERRHHPGWPRSTGSACTCATWPECGARWPGWRQAGLRAHRRLPGPRAGRAVAGHVEGRSGGGLRRGRLGGRQGDQGRHRCANWTRSTRLRLRPA